MEVFKKILLILGIIILLAGIAFVGYGFYKKATTNIPNPIATMEVENYGTIKIELYPDKAPNTVANFIRLANRGFYNGLTFHRTIPEFMIQGGDKNGDGTGSPSLSDIQDGISGENDKAYNIPGEFIANGYDKNNLKHTKGVLSMARAMHPDSAGSQFFIMVEDAPHLDGQYASFGKLIEGLDVATKIVNTKRDYSDNPYAKIHLLFSSILIHPFILINL